MLPYLLYFWLTLSHYQAVLETVARVKPKKNETKEEKSFKFNKVFNLDNDNGAEETPTLIDRKVKQSLLSLRWVNIQFFVYIQDNVFIISNFKSKYPVLQLDLRLISDLVVVLSLQLVVNCFCLCRTTGLISELGLSCYAHSDHLLTWSFVMNCSYSVIHNEFIQVETVAQFWCNFPSVCPWLEFSTTKLRVVRAVAILGGLLQILFFMCLCGIIASVCSSDGF
ncbi:hypothetical protein SASPL_150844 [Salvia splendens]|uniref:Uncharacterized protein n=1 Tax=Salvia splendens TaxID=180675 RepID=A0A8X8W7H6_SALSN|nr:hypothetical protein SASPL_150844 [Salvia splendens]